MRKIPAFVVAVVLAMPYLTWAAEHTLCEAGEQLVWSCRAGKKTYSVCASRKLTDSVGYMQYRVGTSGKTEFVYPAAQVHPFGKFSMTMGPHGASLEFENGRFKYSVAEEAKDLPVIVVHKDDRQIATVQCKDQAGGLLDNATLDLLKAAGISK